MSLSYRITRQLLNGSRPFIAPHKLFSTSQVGYVKLSQRNDKLDIGKLPTSQTTGFTPSSHWSVERAVASGLVPLFPLAFIYENPVTNFIVVSTISIHVYWGIAQIVLDYTMPRVYGNVVQPVLLWTWRSIAALGFLGLLYFNQHDIGIISLIKEIWKL